MSQNKCNEANPHYVKPEDCDHVTITHNKCDLGYHLWKTCQDCFLIFPAGDIRDVSKKAAKMSKEDRTAYLAKFERVFGVESGVRDITYQIWKAERDEISDRLHFERLEKLSEIK